MAKPFCVLCREEHSRTDCPRRKFTTHGTARAVTRQITAAVDDVRDRIHRRPMAFGPKPVTPVTPVTKINPVTTKIPVTHKRGPKPSGNALAAADRAKAYRARKKAKQLK